MIISEINNNESSFAVLSIAYDRGWRFTVNDEKVCTFNVNGEFLGFNIPESVGLIKLYFVLIGFNEGVLISFISLFILIILIFFDKRISLSLQNTDKN